MTLQQLATLHGVTLHTVKKWSPEKRQRLIKEAQQGIIPQVAALIGELAVACYKAQARTGKCVKFELWHSNYAFEVLLFELSLVEPTSSMLVERSDLNCINLSGALALVEAL